MHGIWYDGRGFFGRDCPSSGKLADDDVIYKATAIRNTGVTGEDGGNPYLRLAAEITQGAYIGQITASETSSPTIGNRATRPSRPSEAVIVD